MSVSFVLFVEIQIQSQQFYLSQILFSPNSFENNLLYFSNIDIL